MGYNGVNMPKEFDKSVVKDRILKERKSQGLSQIELSKRAKITPAALSQIEKGSRVPSIPVLYRISDALGVTLDFLVGSANTSELHDLLQNEEVKTFYKGFQGLSQEDKDTIIKNIEFLKSKND